VLLRVSGPITPALVVAVPGSRYFFIVVTFAHILGLGVSISRLIYNPQSPEVTCFWVKKQLSSTRGERKE